MDNNRPLVKNWNDYKVWVNISTLQGWIFTFFTEGVEKFEVGCKSYAICHSCCSGRSKHEMSNQSVPAGVKQHCSGVKHFLKGFKKSLGGF